MSLLVPLPIDGRTVHHLLVGETACPMVSQCVGQSLFDSDQRPFGNRFLPDTFLFVAGHIFAGYMFFLSQRNDISM